MHVLDKPERMHLRGSLVERAAAELASQCVVPPTDHNHLQAADQCVMLVASDHNAAAHFLAYVQIDYYQSFEKEFWERLS